MARAKWNLEIERTRLDELILAEAQLSALIITLSDRLKKYTIDGLSQKMKAQRTRQLKLDIIEAHERIQNLKVRLGSEH